MPTIQGKRITRHWTQNFDAAAAELFPLLCPVREYDWIPIWSCKMVYTESGIAENNCIFTTDLPGEGPKIWTISRYERDRQRIEFVIVCPESHVEKLDVIVEPTGSTGCKLNWSRTYTSLTKQGDAVVDAISGEVFDDRMAKLGALLRHYLATGEMASIT